MGKFKKGTRVRLLERHDDAGPEVGALGTIYGKGIDKGTRDVIWDDGFLHGHEGEADDRSTNHWYVPKSKLEVVTDGEAAPTAEPWVPKVGDRVRLKADTRGPGSILRIVSEGAHVRYDNWFEGHDGHTEDGSKNCWWDSFDNLEPIPVTLAAPLTIEAGHYYKTRDGRKVGPMVPTKHPWTDNEGLTSAFDKEDGEQYSADGFWLAGERNCASDLIAEWIDEPVAVAPATATGNTITLTLGIDTKPLASQLRELADAIEAAAA